MNSWKIVLAAVVIFCAGMITGSLLVRHVPGKPPANTEPVTAEPAARPLADSHVAAPKPEVPLPRLAEKLSKELVRRLDKELHLTLAQSNHIATIVAEGQERNRVIWTNVAPHMRKVMQDVNQQIRAELSPDQLRQFEELMKPLRPPHRPAATNDLPASAAVTNVPPAAPTNAPPGV
jgi:hypothetical protein